MEPMSDLSTFVLLISVLFVIGREALLPERLSRLLGVLYLFVHLSIVTVSVGFGVVDV